MSNLSAIALGVTPQGDNPCVGSGAGWNGSDCVGLQTPGDQGYSIALAMLPFASSGALARQNTEVAGATANKTYGEILQRLTNALAWGQIDQNSANGRGGWYYTLNSTTLDGSTVGWDILGFLDAAAAGATVPPWVATEFKFGFDKALNNDGTFDYNGDGNPRSITAWDRKRTASACRGCTGSVRRRVPASPRSPIPSTAGGVAQVVPVVTAGVGARPVIRVAPTPCSITSRA